MKLNFWKYEGVGSDYIMIDARTDQEGMLKTDGEETHEIPSELIRAMCKRHKGIGAQGLIILASESGYDFRMLNYNSEGAELNVCGNGARCATLFAHHMGVGAMTKSFIGRDGEHCARILSDNGESAIIEISMNDVKGYEYSEKVFTLDVGIPHYVEFVKDVSEIDVVKQGLAICNSERFKSSGGINVDFVEVLRHGQIKIRTFDRETEQEAIASGTGAVASAISTHIYAQNDADKFTVITAGGNLDVCFEVPDKQLFKNITLTGPARRIFKGVVNSGNLIR